MPGDSAFLDDVPGAAELLRRQHGQARRVQLRELGITRKHVESQVRARRWRLVAPEVVSVDNGRLDRDQLRWRAVLHASVGWLSGRSALEVKGLRGFEPEHVHLLVPRGARPSPLEGVVIHVSDRLDGLDPSLEHGLALVRGARAVVDAVAWSPHPRVAAGLLIDAVRQGIADPRDIDDELAAAGRIRHKVAAREALVAVLGGAESLAEVDIAPLLRRAGITRFRRQARSGGRRYDLEAILADGSVLVVEVDGTFHESTSRRWADSERDADTAADGKLLVRVPVPAIRQDPYGVVARLRRIARAAERRAS